MLDYIIVGQGLAGTHLGFELESRGKSIRIIDNNFKNSSSKVAGGMFNPITGRNMVKTWKADDEKQYHSVIFHFNQQLVLDIKTLNLVQQTIKIHAKSLRLRLFICGDYIDDWSES